MNGIVWNQIKVCFQALADFQFYHFSVQGNGQQIGYNWGVRPEYDEVAISVPLREQGWFLLNSREDGTNSVSREDFSLILSNLTKLLIRAKFHTDQIEGR